MSTMRILEERVASLHGLVIQKQQEILTLEIAISGLAATRDGLRAEVESTVAKSQVKDPSNIAYPMYATTTGRRADQCDSSIESLEILRKEAQLALESLQSDLASAQRAVERIKSRREARERSQTVPPHPALKSLYS